MYCSLYLPSSKQSSFESVPVIIGARGGVVVKALRYKGQVTGSIPYGIIGIFQWYNPSGRTTALGSTQPSNRNEYQVYFLGVKAAGA